jgi:hypothetical protein
MRVFVNGGLPQNKIQKRVSLKASQSSVNAGGSRQILRTVVTGSTVATLTMAVWRMSTTTGLIITGTTGRFVLWKSLNKLKKLIPMNEFL